LGQALSGHTVSTALPDGTVLRGHVLDVSADQLRFDVNKTSNRALYPKGELSLAKNQLKVFSYTERRGHWRAIGATIGAAAGVAATLPIWATANNEGGFDPGDLPGTITLAGVGGGAALGYGLGHAADTHEVMVIITKD
jgi:hypothetical protein